MSWKSKPVSPGKTPEGFVLCLDLPPVEPLVMNIEQWGVMYGCGKCTKGTDLTDKFCRHCGTPTGYRPKENEMETRNTDGPNGDGTLTHPAVIAILRWFDCDHLPPHLQPIVRQCHQVAHLMASDIPSDPELTAGLRKLLEAKDCFVRAAIKAKEKGA